MEYYKYYLAGFRDRAPPSHMHLDKMHAYEGFIVNFIYFRKFIIF
jgi:hypothetical protein